MNVELSKKTTAFTGAQVASVLKCELSMVEGWFAKGQLRGYRVTEQGTTIIKIPRQNIISFLNAQKMPLPPELAAQE